MKTLLLAILLGCCGCFSKSVTVSMATEYGIYSETYTRRYLIKPWGWAADLMLKEPKWRESLAPHVTKPPTYATDEPENTLSLPPPSAGIKPGRPAGGAL